MKTRMLSVLGILVIIATLTFVYFNNPKPIYGNDEASIIKLIRSVGYDEWAIEIVGIKDFEGNRIAAFLYNNMPGYALFTKNESGEYAWNHVEVRESENLSIFALIPDLQMFAIVTNVDNNVSKMEVTINGEEVVQEFTPFVAEFSWLEIPTTTSNNIRFDNYKFYDENGELLKSFDNN
ncbi:hypothetical protein [Sutcliffiella horikoshii]|uniref:hypothetical protein n=1 Tax=Sutcliffiella horikoshii TaxID=79883 RepID=UPI001F21F912|nr:hypothetical protein [Sutcliffiella horikoshii]MCG1023255.1 hypothetical protein [Sutcliffiella horikoshii]